MQSHHVLHALHGVRHEAVEPGQAPPAGERLRGAVGVRRHERVAERGEHARAAEQAVMLQRLPQRHRQACMRPCTHGQCQLADAAPVRPRCMLAQQAGACSERGTRS